MKFKLALFDLGGTLINYDNHSWFELGKLGCIEGARFLKESLNTDIDVEKLNADLHEAVGRMIEYRGDSDYELDLSAMVSKTLGEFGVILSDGIPQKFIEAYYRPIHEQITLFPYAIEILSEIKRADMRIGLVSNTIFPAEYHRAEMRDFGIYDLFDFTLFSSDEKIRKPGKEIFLKTLKLGESDPDKTIFIGDRLLEDIGGPQSVGISAVLKYVDGHDYSADIVPFETIHELEELERIIF